MTAGQAGRKRGRAFQGRGAGRYAEYEIRGVREFLIGADESNPCLFGTALNEIGVGSVEGILVVRGD